MKIVVLEADSVGRDVSWEPLGEYGEVSLYDATPQELVAERIQDADIVVPNKCILNESNLAGAKNLKMICEAATGYNNIDVDYCREHQILVSNVKAYSTDVVAQHTFALLLSLYEKLDYYTTYVEDGDYSASASFSHVARQFHELAGKCYGIIGMGNIGRKVAQIATAFGCKVIYYSPSGNTYDVPYQRVEFEDLLAWSDVISIHTPLTERTKGLMNKDAFARMKRTAMLINVARGPIVVEADLVRAIEDCEIAAAGLDVFETEPLPIQSPLRQVNNRDRLILTPHVAWGSIEARTRVVEDICKSVKAYLDGEPRSLVY